MAMHLKNDSEKPMGMGQHDEGGLGLDSRTRTEGEESELAPMQTPGAKWEKKTIWKIDLRLLIIREFPPVLPQLHLPTDTY